MAVATREGPARQVAQIIAVVIAIALSAFLVLLFAGVGSQIAKNTDVNETIQTAVTNAFTSLANTLPLLAVLGGLIIVLAMIFALPGVRDFIASLLGGGGTETG